MELTEETELMVPLTLPPSTAAGAVCVGGSRQTEVTDGVDGAERVDEAHRSGRADGGTDAAPTAAGAVCVRGSRQTDVTGGGDEASGADRRDRADGGADASSIYCRQCCLCPWKQTDGGDSRHWRG